MAQDNNQGKFAIKIIKQMLTYNSTVAAEKSKNLVKSELEILQNMSHKNVVRLHEFIERPEKRKFYLVMDYI